MEALEYAVSNGAGVINISQNAGNTRVQDEVEFNQYYWRITCNNAKRAGVTIVAGVGNDYYLRSEQDSGWAIPYNIALPAAVPPPSDLVCGGVIGIGATSDQDLIALWTETVDSIEVQRGSSVGPTTWQNIEPWVDYEYPSSSLQKPDYAAPGKDVLCLAPGGAFGPSSGTSYAAPMISGVVALMLSANPDLTPMEINQRLFSSSEDLGDSLWDRYFGHGLINADLAVTYASPTYLAANYYSSTHLTRGVYVVQGTVKFNGAITLTLDPGVVIKFDTGAILHMDNAQLYAVGTPTDSIIFTSLKDDYYSGDTNGDANATRPSPGDWGRIILDENDTSIMEFCHVRYAGFGNMGSVQFYNGCNSTIRRSLVSQSGSSGLWVHESSPWIVGNRLADNTGEAVTLRMTTANRSSSPYFFSDTYPELANTFAGNGLDVVTHAAFASLSTCTWRRSGYPLHVLGSVAMYSSAILTMEPGLIVKMAPGASLKTEENPGGFQFVGTPTDSIVITSVKDDTYGGDSNKDGSATLPNPGDWDRIWLYLSDGSLLEYCHIRYAGSSSQGAVGFTNAANSTVRRCLVSQSGSSGLWVHESSPWIVGNRLADNTGEAVTLRMTTANRSSSPYFFSDTYPELANTFAGNGLDVVTHAAFASLSTCTWRRSGYPLHVLGSVAMYSSAILTMEPGLIVKMAPGASLKTEENPRRFSVCRHADRQHRDHIGER